MKINVGKGLIRAAALKKARKKYRRDYRGFTYNKKTGVAIFA